MLVSPRRRRLLASLLTPALLGACTVVVAPVPAGPSSSVGAVAQVHASATPGVFVENNTFPVAVSLTPGPVSLMPVLPGATPSTGVVATPSEAPATITIPATGLVTPAPIALPPVALLLPPVVTAPVGVATPNTPVVVPPTPALPEALPAAVATTTTTPPTTTTTTGGFHEGGVVFNNPFGYPSSVAVGLPAGLVASDGSSYKVLDDGTPSASQFFHITLAPYVFTTELIDLLLRNAEMDQLTPGQDYVGADGSKPGKFVTVKLTVTSDHALLSVWRGQTESPAMEMVAVEWTGPNHGRAVFHSVDVDQPGKSVFVTTFDHSQNTAAVDNAIFDPTGDGSGGPQTSSSHLVVSSPTADPLGIQFEQRAALTVNRPNDPQRPFYLAVAANFLGDHQGGAMWFAIGDASTNNNMLFFPEDGKSLGQTPPAPHSFFLNALGLDQLKLLASPAQKAIVPSDGELPTSYPADPGVGNAFTDPRYDFPQ